MLLKYNQYTELNRVFYPKKYFVEYEKVNENIFWKNIIKYNENLKYNYDFKDVKENILELFSWKISYEEIKFLEFYIKLFLDYVVDLDELDIEIDFKLDYETVVIPLVSSKINQNVWIDNFLEDFKEFILLNFWDLPFLSWKLTYLKNNNNHIFRFEFNRENVKDSIISWYTSWFMSRVMYTLDNKENFKYKNIYDDIEDLIDYLSYEKDFYPLEFLLNSKDKLENIQNFIFEENEIFSENIDKNFIFYFLSIMWFFNLSKLQTYNDFEKDAFWKWYEIVEKNNDKFYQELKDNLYNFIKEIK